MPLCNDCAKGVIHEGTPVGNWEKIGGVDCYVAVPPTDYPKDKVILQCPDVYGAHLVNAQLLADGFAQNGYKVVIVDYLNGDPAPAEFGLNPDSKFDLWKWYANHGPETTRPTLDRVIEGLREQGVTTFVATGYCIGARSVFDMAFEGIIKAAVVSHPSLLVLPDDYNKYAEVSKAPLLINSCEIDEQFPHASQKVADEILGDGKFAPGYKREYFPGCTHGFAVRGDLSVPKIKEGHEGAFKATIEWLLKYL